jgi:hypothetical protein
MCLHLRLPVNLVAHHPGYFVTPIYIGDCKITKVISDRVILLCYLRYCCSSREPVIERNFTI